MTTDWVNIISAVGFPIVLVLLGINLFAKHIPTLLTEWRRFTVANENFAKTVKMAKIKWKSKSETEREQKERETLQKQKEQSTLAIKLIAPTLSDEDLTQIPLLFDEWAAGVDYVADNVVRFEDILYRVITSHRSQSDWPPSDVPALYKIIEAPGEIGPWRQPLGEHDAYQMGDKVTHKEQTWVSTADNNVWEPGVHGWEITT